MSNEQKARRGYSLIETLLTIVIIQAISAIVVVNVTDVGSPERLTRAAQETIGALRYARMLAMSSGVEAGVDFDTSTQKLRVYQGTGAATVNSSVMRGGKYVVDFSAQAELAGVTISVAGDATTSCRIAFSALGSTNNNGTVTLRYGNSTRAVTIPPIGDAR